MGFRQKILPSLLEGFRGTVDLSHGERLRFLVQDRQETYRAAYLLALLAILLIPLFAILDHYSYPEHFVDFLKLRIVCILAIVGVVVLMKFKAFHQNYRVYAILIPMIPALVIGGMIYLIQDPGTPYYAGLTLCLVAIGFVFNWSYREAIVFSILVLGIYLMAAVPGLNTDVSKAAMAEFSNNCLFILANSVVVSLGSMANYRKRLREFENRQQIRKQQSRLEVKNEELKRTLNELSDTERQLIQSEKMASLGQLSAGVIHEIGNPLNFSNQALFVLRRRMRKEGREDEFEDIITDMQEGFDRMKEIVGELREFTHGAGAENVSFTADACVSSAIRMLGKEIESSGIEIEEDVAPGIVLNGVKNQITQVIINLIQNALHACENVDKPCRISISGYRAGEYLLLRVSDTGVGIAREHERKLFDPFFTTKAPGKGTGLGLSISFRIIEAHGGTIDVSSIEGESTTFSVMLPAITAPVESDSFSHSQN